MGEAFFKCFLSMAKVFKTKGAERLLFNYLGQRYDDCILVSKARRWAAIAWVKLHC